MTKLIVAFRNFSNASKMVIHVRWFMLLVIKLR